MLIALVAELKPGPDPAADDAPAITVHQQLVHEQRRLHSVLEACGVGVVPVGSAARIDDLCHLTRALVLDEVAFVPDCGGATAGVLDLVGRGRDVVRLEAPGLLDGRNVLQVERRLFIGVPPRTSADALRTAAEPLAMYGYDVVPVALSQCAVLRHACSYVGRGTVLADARLVDPHAFAGLELLPIADAGSLAASVLFAPPVAIVSARTARAAVAQCGLSWTSVDLRGFARIGLALADLATIVRIDDAQTFHEVASTVGDSRLGDSRPSIVM